MSSVEFLDLDEAESTENIDSYDICIIGAGAAGIYLAVELAQKSLSVILLEAGSRTNVDAANFDGMKTVFDKEVYPGAINGRYFGLGGTTSHWGGALVPHTKFDLRSEDQEPDVWSHIIKVVNKNGPSVLQKLGWRQGDDFSQFAKSKLDDNFYKLKNEGIEVSSNLFLPFRRKNFRHLFDQPIPSAGRLKVIYNAVVTGFEQHDHCPNIRLNSAEVMSGNGKKIKISADNFILSAGAIESTRVLLELKRISSKSVFHPNSGIGCFLGDHLSSTIATVASNNVTNAIKMFAPRFHKGWMRSYRFMLGDSKKRLPRAFAHFIFDHRNPGFELAKKVLSSVQAQRFPKIASMDILKGAEGIARLGAHKYARSALYIPADAKVHLQLDVEQFPQKENRIWLDNNFDKYGRPIVKISWQITSIDLENIHHLSQIIFEKWANLSPNFPVITPLDLTGGMSKPRDAFHPVGVCRIGSKDNAVVDKDLKVWGVENLSIVSTGVLPSAGTANPTFTLLCLADNLIKHLSGKYAV